MPCMPTDHAPGCPLRCLLGTTEGGWCGAAPACQPARVRAGAHLRHVGLGQQEDADDGVVLDAVVLGLQGDGKGVWCFLFLVVCVCV